MACITYDTDTKPKRGDVLQSTGSLYYVLKARRVRSKISASRWKLFVAKSRELDDSTLLLLERSAQRSGGVVCHPLHWYSREPKRLQERRSV